MISTRNYKSNVARILALVNSKLTGITIIAIIDLINSINK